MPSDKNSPDDPGYEVVSDPGYEVVIPPPPRAAAPVPVAKPLPAKPLPPKPSAAETKVMAADTTVAPVKPKKPAVRVVEFEDGEEDEDRSPRARRRRAEEDERDDRPGDKPRLTKADRRRIREEMRQEEAAERAVEAEEWTVPGILMGVGGVMILGSAVIIGMGSAKAAVGVLLMLFLSVVWIVVSVPIIIVMLMVIGKACGIEYGSAKHAFRSLGAIVILATGIYWAGGMLGFIGWMIAPIVAFIVTYTLFVKFFELDASEARLSMAAVNFITGVGNYLFRVLLITSLIVGSLPDKPPGGDPDYQDAAEQWDDEMPPPGGGMNNTNPRGQPKPANPPALDPDE
jgi:hypothetical protein